MARINFERIVARDCFGYALLDFNFAAGINSIEGGNGASKTSIFLTLMQGLFNKNAKGAKIDEVNNTITGLPYEIEVYFTDDKGCLYWVVNSRKTGSIEIYKDGKPKHVKRIPDNLKIIEDILGVDYSTFQDLIYQSPKSSINLLEKDSDTSRKAFINKILKLDELDAQLEQKKQQDKEICGKGGKLELLRNQLLLMETGIDEEYQEVSEERDVTSIEEQLSRLNLERDELKEKIQALKVTLSGILKDQKVYEDNKEKLDKIAKLKDKICTLGYPEDTLENLLDQREQYQVHIKKIENVNLQLTNVLGLNARNEELKKVAKELKREISLLNLATTKEQTLTTIDCLKQDYYLAESKYAGAKAELTKLKECATLKQCPTCHSHIDATTLEYKISKTIQDKSDLFIAIELIKGSLEVELAFKKQHEKKEELERKIDSLQISKEKIDVDGTTKALQQTVMTIQNDTAKIHQLNLDISFCKEFNALESELKKLERETPTNISCTSFGHDLLAVNFYITTEQGKLNVVESGIEECKVQLKETQAFNAAQRTLKAVNEQRRVQNLQIKNKLVSVQQEIEDLETKSDLLKIWISILGPKGFRVHKMQSFLQHLNTTMQKYSEMLCDGRIKCMFFMAEGEIDFTVIDSNKTVSWSCWSEGEKARVKLSCLFAVLELLEVLGSVSFNVLALDEIFSALDISGKEGLFNVLNYLKNKGRSIYTIAHTKLALDTEFNSVIKAYKLDDGTTTIVQ